MNILITGSAGHLGEALVRALKNGAHRVLGTDLLDSPHTDRVGDLSDPEHVRACMQGVDAVIHTATLHKPHVVTHSRQDFVDANITATLNLLEQAQANSARAFVFTSTTSVFGDANTPPPERPAAWITEQTVPQPKNIYGVTKLAAENLCQLFHRLHGLPCVVLRTSRFFPEADDARAVRESYSDDNIKTTEFLYRRVAIDDAVSAHLCAVQRAGEIGFDRFIVSATTPCRKTDLADLRGDARGWFHQRMPEQAAAYERLGWRLPPSIDRVYVNRRARQRLGWRPRFDFNAVLARAQAGQNPLGELAQRIGRKGYHSETFTDGPYPVD